MLPVIDSPSNPTVKALRALGDLKHRRQARQFAAEGVRLIEDALAVGSVPQACLYDPDTLKKTPRGRALLGELLRVAHQSDRRFFPATERALAAAADTLHPQGIIASFAIAERPMPVRSEGFALALVCDDIQDPGNLGTILRSAEGAGVDAVWLTKGCVDLYSPKVVRAAMGAHFRLPVYQERAWSQISADLAQLGIRLGHIYASNAAAVQTYDHVDWQAPSALIVSNEARGAGPEVRELVEGGGGSISIPMAGGTESLNAAMASAIILFEAARQRRAARPTAS